MCLPFVSIFVATMQSLPLFYNSTPGFNHMVGKLWLVGDLGINVAISNVPIYIK